MCAKTRRRHEVQQAARAPAQRWWPRLAAAWASWPAAQLIVSLQSEVNSGPFELSRVRGIPVTDAQLIEDLRRVANQVRSNTASQPQYSLHGRYDMRNLSRRLGGWEAALFAVG